MVSETRHTPLQGIAEHAPRRRVLLLDDEESVLGVLSDYLRSPNLEIVTCRELEAAEAILEHSSFDVVVTDLRVSELGGLEGIRLIRFVTSHFPRTIVLAMSGYVTDEVYAFGKAAGVTAVLEKPLDLPKLRDWVLGEGAVASGADDGEVSDVQPLDEFLASNQVYSVYQPIVDLTREGTPVFGYEALARSSEASPLRNPEILFAYATRKEYLLETDLHCIRAAASRVGELGDMRIFLNIHPRSLTAPESSERLTRTIVDAGIAPGDVVIELTEHHAIVNPDAFRESLARLRQSGFGVAIDDFGVGYANVRLISEIQPNFIKLSGYFAMDVHADPVRAKLIQAMVYLAETLEIPVICEGIENAEDLDIVRSCGVPYGQGYYFARPAKPEDILATYGKAVRLSQR